MRPPIRTGAPGGWSRCPPSRVSIAQRRFPGNQYPMQGYNLPVPAMKDRVALITGGGRGIGEAIARRFASEGARIFITSRTPKDLERVALETGANFDICDVSHPKDVGALVRKIGPVDILVNNAGIAES